MSTPLKPLTEEEKVFIVDNHKIKTVPMMAKDLKRGVKKVYDFMDEQQLPVLNP